MLGFSWELRGEGEAKIKGRDQMTRKGQVARRAQEADQSMDHVGLAEGVFFRENVHMAREVDEEEEQLLPCRHYRQR